MKLYKQKQHIRKSSVIYMTIPADDLLLTMIKYVEILLNIFEFSRV